MNSSSKVHLEFKKNCEQLLKKYSKEKNKICNESLFFGSATGVCIQALEEGTKITHFPNDENLDVFSPKIWKNTPGAAAPWGGTHFSKYFCQKPCFLVYKSVVLVRGGRGAAAPG